jgi:hypothetical protein
MKLQIYFLFFCASLIFVCSCSNGANDPVSGFPNSMNDKDGDLPATVLDFNGTSGVGIFGAYHLSVSDDGMNYELTPARSSMLGEAYLVNGMSFFTMTPCAECLRISGIAVNGDGNLKVTFEIKHPMPKGNINDPPSKFNRLDLDVFDLAMVFGRAEDATTFEKLNKEVYSDILYNADGYTGELGNVLYLPSYGENIILPYKICYTNSQNNRFRMGTIWRDFEVILNPNGINFNLYLTMAYGFSAEYADRLDPTYYIPEFNRKAAWKVEVEPPGRSDPDFGETWDDADTTTEYPVMVEIYDWNHGVVVAPDYPDPANPDHIISPSDIESVFVEIPGMTNLISEAYLVEDDTDGYRNPVTYQADIANENRLVAGTYPGLVKVLDSRMPSTSYVEGVTDSLVDTPNGVDLEWHLINEYATYQVFTATVVSNVAYESGITLGGICQDEVFDIAISSSDHIYLAGGFCGSVDFDTGSEIEVRTADGWSDVFLAKYELDGDLVWVNTWGGNDGSIYENYDWAFDVEIDDTGNAYVVGCFVGTCDFDPGIGVDEHTANGWFDIFLSKFDPDGNYLWSAAWGGVEIDRGHSVAIDNSGNAYVGGYFEDAADFDPGPGVDERIASGSIDSYLCKFDSSGNLQWAKTWGGIDNAETGTFRIAADTAGNIYSYGVFENTVDFDPGPGVDEHTAINWFDRFLGKYDENGNLVWVLTWDGYASIWDRDGGLVIDDANQIYTTGYFGGTVDFDPGPGVDLHESETSGSGYLNKFDSDGTFVWAKTWGSCYTQPRGLSLGNNDDIYICGAFYGLADFDPTSKVVEYSSADGSLFVSVFDETGSFKKVITWGGENNYGKYVIGTVISPDDDLHIVGNFASSIDLSPGEAEDIHYSQGNTDIFILTLNQL